MTLGHNTLHYMRWTAWCVWLPEPGHPRKDGCNCLWSLVSMVACCQHRLLWRHSVCLHCRSSQGSVELFTCRVCSVSYLVYSHQWPSFTALQRCNHCLYNVWLQLAVAASIHFNDAAWSEHSTWWYGLSHAWRSNAAADPLYLYSAISLSFLAAVKLETLTRSPLWLLQKGSATRCL